MLITFLLLILFLLIIPFFNTIIKLVFYCGIIYIVSVFITSIVNTGNLMLKSDYKSKIDDV